MAQTVEVPDNHYKARAEAAEAEVGRLREALFGIAHSGPVNEDGKDDAYAGWEWCYERANEALAPKEPTKE